MKLLFTVLFFIFIFTLNSAPQAFFGSFIFPLSIKQKPLIYLFYTDGKAITTRDGTFELNEDERCSILNILVTEELCEILDGQANVKYFQTVSSSRYFHISRLISCNNKAPDDGMQTSWDIQEVAIKYPFKIPMACTLIILMPVKWIDHFEAENCDSKSIIIKLPKIVLKSDLTQREIETGLSKSYSTAIDLKTFHGCAKAEKTITHSGLTTVALSS
jgi:hypothetical protein